MLYGNISTGYAGTVTFSSSDMQAGLPAGYTFTASGRRRATFTATLKTAGTQSLTVKDTAVATAVGSQTGIGVSAASTAASFTVSGFPATTAGVAHTFTVTARDAFRNVCQGYAGTVTFGSSDVQAGLPAGYTFTAADAGVHAFTATLKTAGSQSLTVRMRRIPRSWGARRASGQCRRGGAVPHFGAEQRHPGVGFKFTVTVVDAYGNVATATAARSTSAARTPGKGRRITRQQQRQRRACFQLQLQHAGLADPHARGHGQ